MGSTFRAALFCIEKHNLYHIKLDNVAKKKRKRIVAEHEIELYETPQLEINPLTDWLTSSRERALNIEKNILQMRALKNRGQKKVRMDGRK